MEGKKAKVSDFEKLIEDASFLNQLQSGVNRWIKEIQKVKLSIVQESSSNCGYVTVPYIGSFLRQLFYDTVGASCTAT